MSVLILKALGWQTEDLEARKIVARTPRCIAIYPHTSFLDFAFYLLYRGVDLNLGKRCRVLINPIFMDKFAPILRPLGGISSTRRHIKGGGAIDRICEELEKLPEFVFLISPKGSMESHHEWRSGFYYLAKKLKCPVMPLGFDFEQRKIIVKEPFDVSNMTLEEAITRGKKELYSIVPYNPEKAEYEVRSFEYTQLGVTSNWRAVTFFVIACILIILVIWWFSYGRYARRCARRKKRGEVNCQ